jgi:uncharacterized membrane protein YcgQ (UPF0703/DUF1980 family)
MRKNKLGLIALILAIAASFFTVSCTKPKAEDGNFNNNEAINIVENYRNTTSVSNNNIIEIREKMFISQVNDVYLNADDYLGKTIKLEGIFKKEQGYEKSYCFVLRYGPGCCGADGNVGFEIAWTNGKAKSYPAVDSWVEATGVLKTYEENGYSQYLYLDLSSLNVLSRRGAERVIQ